MTPAPPLLEGLCTRTQNGAFHYHYIATGGKFLLPHPQQRGSLGPWLAKSSDMALCRGWPLICRPALLVTRLASTLPDTHKPFPSSLIHDALTASAIIRRGGNSIINDAEGRHCSPPPPPDDASGWGCSKPGNASRWCQEGGPTPLANVERALVTPNPTGGQPPHRSTPGGFPPQNANAYVHTELPNDILPRLDGTPPTRTAQMGTSGLPKLKLSLRAGKPFGSRSTWTQSRLDPFQFKKAPKDANANEWRMWRLFEDGSQKRHFVKCGECSCTTKCSKYLE